MGLLQFIGIVFVVVIICYCAVWLLTQFSKPNPPADIAVKCIYGLGGLIIIMVLLNALGLGHDVMIPQIFGGGNVRH